MSVTDVNYYKVCSLNISLRFVNPVVIIVSAIFGSAILCTAAVFVGVWLKRLVDNSVML